MGTCTSGESFDTDDSAKRKKQSVSSDDADKPETSGQTEAQRKLQRMKELREERERKKKEREEKERREKDEDATFDKTRLFGVPVKKSAQLSDPERGLCPAPVTICVNWLREHGMDEEGLFRIPGSLDRVKWYKRQFDGGDYKVVIADDENVQNVASIIIRFLNDLDPKSNTKSDLYSSDPTGWMKEANALSRHEDPERQKLSDDRKKLSKERTALKKMRAGPEKDKKQAAHDENQAKYDQEKAAFQSHEKQVEEREVEQKIQICKELLGRLDRCAYEVYRVLCSFLHEAAQHPTNKMTHKKFALCTFPHIMDMMELMIGAYDQVFDAQ